LQIGLAHPIRRRPLFVERMQGASVTFMHLPPFAAFSALPLAVFGALFLGPILFPARPECHADWTDLIRFGGITYESWPSYPPDRPDPSVLGSEFARVAFRAPSDCDYKFKDGDAAHLQPGTPVYTVNSYRTDFLLATFERGVVKLYEATNVPGARIGADLLDIDGKVALIRITVSDAATTELGRIDDPAQVDSFVAGVLRAPVTTGDPGRRTGEMYRVAFHMHDGIVIRAAYWEDAGELERGVRYPLPLEARDLIAMVISR
jgi:hypothetical protein